MNYKLRLFNRKAQNTAEYAIVIGLVVAVALAMQTYIKRGIQGRSHDATDKLYSEIANSPNWNKVSTTAAESLKSKQFEPTKLSSKSTLDVTEDSESYTLDATSKLSTRAATRTTQQAAGDYQKWDY